MNRRFSAPLASTGVVRSRPCRHLPALALKTHLEMCDGEGDTDPVLPFMLFEVY